jgi:two-component sensor histidine kinase
VNAAEAAMSAASKAIALREQSLRRETERTTFLVKELAHRLKNLLAIIAAVVRQTSRTTVDFTLFVREFEGRLGAIARSVDLLVQSDWAGVPLRELLRHQLEAFSDISRFELSGPDLELTPKATEQLGIALHELTTNAVKHGALSREGGSVVIAWKIEADDFTFNWKELGGPRVTRPDRAGFGRTVVERVVPNALGGRSVLSFDPSGVEWHFRGPLTEALAGD